MLQHRRLFTLYLIVWLILTLGMAARAILRGSGSAATVTVIENLGRDTVRWFKTSLSLKLAEDGTPPGRIGKWLGELQGQKKTLPEDSERPDMNTAPIPLNARQNPGMGKYAPLAELSPK